MKAGGHPRHGPNHIDCLVGGEKSLDFKRKATDYIYKIRPLAIATFSGLNTRKMLGGKWIPQPNRNPPFTYRSVGRPLTVPSGTYSGKTVPDVARSYVSSPYAAILYGGNNRSFFNKTYTTEAALLMFFKEMSLVFNGSSFDVVFISTILPRGADIKNGILDTNIKCFNDGLLSFPVRRDPKFKIHIRDRSGTDRILPWVPVDMTEALPYDKILIHPEKYFCEKNRSSRHPDYTHFNATHLETFYRKLDKAISKYVRAKKK